MLVGLSNKCLLCFLCNVPVFGRDHTYCRSRSVSLLSFPPRSSSSLFSLLSCPVPRLHHTSRRPSYPDPRLSNLIHRLGLCLLAASSWLGSNTAILLFPSVSCNSACTIPGCNLHAQFTVNTRFLAVLFPDVSLYHHHTSPNTPSGTPCPCLRRLLFFPPDMLCLHFAHSRSPSSLKYERPDPRNRLYNSTVQITFPQRTAFRS